MDKLTDHNGDQIEDYEATVRNMITMDESYWDAIHTGMRRVVEGKSYYQDLTVNVARQRRVLPRKAKTGRTTHFLFVMPHMRIRK